MKYKVLVFALLLKNNVQAEYGDEVTADQLTDSVQNLVKGGYIEEVSAPAADDQSNDAVASAQAIVDAAQAVLDDAQKAADDAKASGADLAVQTDANSAVTKAKQALGLAKGNLTKAINKAAK